MAGPSVTKDRRRRLLPRRDGRAVGCRRCWYPQVLTLALAGSTARENRPSGLLAGACRRLMPCPQTARARALGVRAVPRALPVSSAPVLPASARAPPALRQPPASVLRPQVSPPASLPLQACEPAPCGLLASLPRSCAPQPCAQDAFLALVFLALVFLALVFLALVFLAAARPVLRTVRAALRAVLRTVRAVFRAPLRAPALLAVRFFPLVFVAMASAPILLCCRTRPLKRTRTCSNQRFHLVQACRPT